MSWLSTRYYSQLATSTCLLIEYEIFFFFSMCFSFDFIYTYYCSSFESSIQNSNQIKQNSSSILVHELTIHNSSSFLFWFDVNHDKKLTCLRRWIKRNRRWQKSRFFYYKRVPYTVHTFNIISLIRVSAWFVLYSFLANDWRIDIINTGKNAPQWMLKPIFAFFLLLMVERPIFGKRRENSYEICQKSSLLWKCC